MSIWTDLLVTHGHITRSKLAASLSQVSEPVSPAGPEHAATDQTTLRESVADCCAQTLHYARAWQWLSFR